MAKNKNNQAIWGVRIKKKTSTLFQKVGSSIEIDKRLYKEDIAGSIAHVEMLFKQKIIPFKVKNKILYGLNKIEKEISNKKFQFNKSYEDIHMNIEKRLFQIIGDEAGYIHTARSRNDQIITDLKIWMRSANNEINKSIENMTINVLVENRMKDKSKLFGRSEYMTSVLFNGSDDLIGKIVKVKVQNSNRNTLFGETEDQSNQKVA